MRATRVLLFLVVLLVPWTSGAQVPTFSHEGRPYVDLSRVAESVKSRLEATPESSQAFLRTPGHLVTFTRNWARVSVDGTPIVLDAPVRVDKDGRWIAPEKFVTDVLPRLVPAAVAAPPAPPSSAPAPPAPAPRPATAPPASAVPPAASAASRAVTPPGAAASPPAAPRAAALPAAVLEELRYRSYPSFTRIVLETSLPVGHRVETGNPREARVRLLAVTGADKTHEIRDGFVDAVRLERAGPDTVLRVALDEVASEIKVTALADPPRLLLDFVRPAPPALRDSRPAATPLRVLVLDAGHGGHDSGAVGPGGLQEKELVLDVTRRVAKLVSERLNVKVVLSREADHFVTLRDRTSLANKAGADLFVSIHANAHRESASQGVETYFLSSEATDSAARQVAAAENGVLQLEKPSSRGRNGVVNAMIWDLLQSGYQSESSRLAEIVQDSMTQSLRIPNRGVKQAGFYVLGGAAMPAVLIEIGFVSNPTEERRLKESKYRDEIARAIFAGLAEYKRQWDLRARVDVPTPVRVGRER
jgi:N-acetylmuramoyl-L-alanine amidase